MLKRGDKVLVDRECKRTENSFTIAREMRQYFGTIQVVSSCADISVRLEGDDRWNWHIVDLKPIEVQEDIKEQMKPLSFDVNELVEV